MSGGGGSVATAPGSLDGRGGGRELPKVPKVPKVPPVVPIVGGLVEPTGKKVPVAPVEEKVEGPALVDQGVVDQGEVVQGGVVEATKLE